MNDRISEFLKESSAYAVSLVSSTEFLHAWVGFCGTAIFAVAFVIAIKVSKLDPLRMRDFLSQVQSELRCKSNPASGSSAESVNALWLSRGNPDEF